MRRSALMLAAALFAALSISFAASGSRAAEKPGLADALTRTSHLASLHYAVHIGISQNGTPFGLHIRGQSDAHTVSVHFKTQGMSGGDLVYGPYLYVEAPDGVAVNGTIRWLRTPLARIPANSRELAAMRALKVGPLLALVARGRLHGNTAGIFRGPVAYDDPVVRDSLAHLTGGIEFRALRLTVHVQRGLIDRLRLTGKTADGTSTFSLAAHLFAFNRPLHLVPPKPGTFMDLELEQLSE
ncbi:MAG TPA: hypothetical protein VHQ89_12580 [Gaiellaceae bacterium]|jgi:hypothetical protein|nr:hypothetical protein [Gaiellaceae bacterium]